MVPEPEVEIQEADEGGPGSHRGPGHGPTSARRLPTSTQRWIANRNAWKPDSNLSITAQSSNQGWRPFPTAPSPILHPPAGKQPPHHPIPSGPRGHVAPSPHGGPPPLRIPASVPVAFPPSPEHAARHQTAPHGALDALIPDAHGLSQLLLVPVGC